MTAPLTATLLVSCRDRTGLVAALSDFVSRNQGNIIDLDQHAESADDDGEHSLFFMRLRWDLTHFKLDRGGIDRALSSMAQEFSLSWNLTYSDHRPRVAIFASRTPHCLYDLLLRQQLGELGGDIVAVLSNHPDLSGAAAHFNIPFHHYAITTTNREAVEAEQILFLNSLHVDLIVLARYMQVLSPQFVAHWPTRIINIHHSFLPAFVGAKPYHQAKQRGVKIIGATAHYVTEELDQGPIIEQDVARVSHRDHVDDLVRKGRDLERQVLSRAVRAHLDQRVLMCRNRTIVFS